MALTRCGPAPRCGGGCGPSRRAACTPPHLRHLLGAAALIGAAACARGPDRGPDREPAADTAAAPPAPPASTALTTTAPSADSAGGTWLVTARGIGPVRAGLPLQDAAAAVGGALTAPAGVEPGACAYLAWRGGPPGVRVMIEGGRIARVDVDSGGVATDAGARVGDSEARVQSLYPGRVAVTPHKYTAGHRYLTVTPATPADSAYRVVFETDGRRVTRYRAGRRPPVEYVEGCG